MVALRGEGYLLSDALVAAVLDQSDESCGAAKHLGAMNICGGIHRRGITVLRRKMDQDQANGARQGWLERTEARAMALWRGGQHGMAERLENASRLKGGELADGLVEI